MSALRCFSGLLLAVALSACGTSGSAMGGAPSTIAPLVAAPANIVLHPHTRDAYIFRVVAHNGTRHYAWFKLFAGEGSTGDYVAGEGCTAPDGNVLLQQTFHPLDGDYTVVRLEAQVKYSKTGCDGPNVPGGQVSGQRCYINWSGRRSLDTVATVTKVTYDDYGVSDYTNDGDTATCGRGKRHPNS